MPEDLNINLRDYLDEKFALLHADLSEIKTHIRTLSDGHNELDKRLTRVEDQNTETARELNEQRAFRQKLMFILIPSAVGLVGWLLVQFITLITG